MATIKFKEESPYLQPVQTHHETDYVYTSFLESCKPGKNVQRRDPIGVALFGIGRAGSIHLGNLVSNKRCRLKYVIDQNEELMDQKLAYFGITTQETTKLTPDQASIVFEDPSISAVIIATPTSSHEDLVMRSLQSGKGVLCEKPISLHVKAVEKCYDTAAQKNVPLLCAMNRRFDPSISEFRNKVHAGAVGEVHMCKTVSRDSPVPPLSFLKISGGIIHDCGVHDVDLICWVLGEFPHKVSAMASSFIPEIESLGDMDTVAINMHFPSGAIGTIDLSRNACYGYDQRLEVLGPKGTLKVENPRPNSISESMSNGVSECPLFHSFASRYHNGYQRELDHFFNLIQGSAELSISKDEVLRVSAVCDAIDQSIKMESVVKVKY